MRRILLIEDDIIDQMSVEREILGNFPDTTFDKTMNFNEALSLLHSFKYDLIISDLNVEQGELKDILPQTKAIPVLVLTGLEPDHRDFTFYTNLTHSCIHKDNNFEYLGKITNAINSIYQSKAAAVKKGKSKQNRSNQVNFDHIERILGNDKNAIIDILKTFLEQNPANLKKLNENIHEKNTAAIGKLAHKIQSGFKLLGLTKIVDLLYEIETDCSSLSEKELLSKHKTISNASDFACKEIKTYLNKK